MRAPRGADRGAKGVWRAASDASDADSGLLGDDKAEGSDPGSPPCSPRSRGTLRAPEADWPNEAPAVLPALTHVPAPYTAAAEEVARLVSSSVAGWVLARSAALARAPENHLGTLLALLQCMALPAGAAGPRARLRSAHVELSSAAGVDPTRCTDELTKALQTRASLRLALVGERVYAARLSASELGAKGRLNLLASAPLAPAPAAAAPSHQAESPADVARARQAAQDAQTGPPQDQAVSDGNLASPWEREPRAQRSEDRGAERGSAWAPRAEPGRGAPQSSGAPAPSDRFLGDGEAVQAWLLARVREHASGTVDLLVFSACDDGPASGCGIAWFAQEVAAAVRDTNRALLLRAMYESRRVDPQLLPAPGGAGGAVELNGPDGRGPSPLLAQAAPRAGARSRPPRDASPLITFEPLVSAARSKLAAPPLAVHSSGKVLPPVETSSVGWRYVLFVLETRLVCHFLFHFLFVSSCPWS